MRIPHQRRTTIRSLAAALIYWVLSLPQVSYAAPPDARITVIVLGDSITAGYGLDANDSYPALLQQRFVSKGVRVVNAGLSGDTTAGGLRRIEWLLKGRCDVLVIALGANDGLRGVPVQETAENLRGIVQKTKQRFPSAKVLLAGMLVPPNMGPDYSERYRAVFPQVARETGSKLLPFLLEGVAGVGELNQADGIHPTATGQQRIAELLAQPLGELLQEFEDQKSVEAQ